MIKNEVYPDIRVVRTKKSLKKSLLTLLKEKRFKDITITDIVTHANVNRGSFYNHYQDKEELLNEIFDDVVSDMVQAYRKPYVENKPFIVNELSPSEVKTFDHVKKNEEFYTTILKSDVFYSFQSRLQEVIKEITKSDLLVYSPKINSDLCASYLAYAIVGIIFNWVKSGFQNDTDYISEQVLELMKIAPKQVFKTWVKI